MSISSHSSTPNLFEFFRGGLASTASSAASSPRGRNVASESINGRMDGYASSATASPVTSPVGSPRSSFTSNPQQLPQPAQNALPNAEVLRANLLSTIEAARNQLEDLITDGNEIDPATEAHIQFLHYQAEAAAQLLESMEEGVQRNPNTNANSTATRRANANIANVPAASVSQAVPIAEVVPIAQAIPTAQVVPTVHHAATPPADRPAQRVDTFGSKLKQFAKVSAFFLVTLPVTAPLAALAAGGMALVASAIVARKVVSIPISWPLLASRLMGINFNATNLKNNKLMNAILGPATINALISPNKTKAATMLAFEVAAVALAAATFGVGSYGLLFTIFMSVSPLTFAGLSLPDFSAYERLEDQSQNNREANRNNNSRPHANPVAQAGTQAA